MAIDGKHLKIRKRTYGLGDIKGQVTTLGGWSPHTGHHECSTSSALSSELWVSVHTRVFPSQERFQVKNPPHTYIQKLQSFLDPSVTRKVKCEAGRPPLAVPYSPMGFWAQTF